MSLIWLVVWLPFFIFPYIGNNHPNWLIFFRGVQTTNQLMIFVQWIVGIVGIVGIVFLALEDGGWLLMVASQ